MAIRKGCQSVLTVDKKKSRNYFLEILCADFLVGVSLETGNHDVPLSLLARLMLSLPWQRISRVTNII